MPLFDDEDDYDDRRPRRRPRRDDYHDERDDYDDLPSHHMAPEDRVSKSGTALYVVGAIGLLLTLVGAVVAGVVLINQPPQQGEEDQVVFVIMGAITAVSIAYFGVMVYGGWQMSKVRSYGWSLAAAILATAAICLGLYGILIMPFGIWALVVLCDPRVKQAFRGPLRPRRAVEDWNDE